MAGDVLLLSDLLGADVLGADHRSIGKLADLTVEVGPTHPALSKIALRRDRGRRIDAYVPWDQVANLDGRVVELSDGATRQPSPGPHDLLLARDVLDTQVVDVAGKRIARVSDVLLVPPPAEVRVLGVDVGAASVWRRLGPRSRTGGRSGREQVVDWADVHLTSARGHQLQVAQPASQIHRLAAAELAVLLAQLPPRTGGRLLAGVPAKAASGALSAGHPETGGRVLRAVPQDAAAALVAGMPYDDAAALLRTLSSERIDALLSGVSSERAATLRRLLAHPAGTAAGLMNTDIRTAAVGEAVEVLRARAAAEPRELDGMATFFVVDGEGRPVGSFEPTDLLANRREPKRVPLVPMSLPVERVIDLFALHDFLALPVVDPDGKLVGVVAVDDILEELLAERLPGGARFGAARGRLRRARRHRLRRSSP